MINFSGSSFTSEHRGWIESWLETKSSPRTREAYEQTIQQLIDFLPSAFSLMDIELTHLQRFLKNKSHQSPYTQRRHRAALQSLYSFLTEHEYAPKNIARSLKKISAPDSLSKRILTEEEVLKMILGEHNERNRILLKLLYVGGLRICEVRELKWSSLQDKGEQGILSIFGKGGKSRSITLSGSIWTELKKFRANKRDFEPIFCSWNDGEVPLGGDQMQQIVRRAALRVGIAKPVSPHWLRHAHASHALNRNCPIHLVQATLGHANIATTGKYLHAQPQESSGQFLNI